MAKKKAAAAKTAPIKPERTRSRAAKVADENQKFMIEREGKLYTWDVPGAPYKANSAHRSAFVGGFRSRVEQVNQGTEAAGPAERFSEGSEIQRAFEDGYNEAARQDGRNVKPAGLTGSKTAAEAHSDGKPVLGAAGAMKSKAKKARG